MEDRIYHGYELKEWDGPSLNVNPCDLCELSNECDRLADDLNNIEYFMCLSKGCIKDTEYKRQHRKAYFKKIK